MRIVAAGVAIAASIGCAAAVASEWLYVASVPSSFGAGPQAGGHLYSVALPVGNPKTIGALKVSGAAIAVTGLAVQPIVGTLYGITTDNSPNHPSSLVTVDPRNANATVVGDLGLAGSDIAFDKHGTLYIWLRETSQIGTVSLKTGEARPVGPTRAASEPGGLAIDGGGRIFAVSSGATGSLDQIDSVSGQARKGPALQGAPYPAGINAISIASDGRIFAINSNRGLPARTALIAIDPITGKVTNMGALPDDSDALVQVEEPWSAAEFFTSAIGLSLLAGLFSLLLVVVLVLRSGRSRPGP